jgi:hypothetical protein
MCDFEGDWQNFAIPTRDGRGRILDWNNVDVSVLSDPRDLPDTSSTDEVDVFLFFE